MAARQICALCSQPDSGLMPVSGIRVCHPCSLGEVADRLVERGFEVKWRSSLLGVPVVPSRMRFAAELGLGKDTGVDLLVVPRLFSHRLIALWSSVITAGDPPFDKRFFARSATPEPARALLTRDPVQEAITVLLSRVRTTEPWLNGVHLSRDRLQIRMTSLDGLGEPEHQELQLASAALALLATGQV